MQGQAGCEEWMGQLSCVGKSRLNDDLWTALIMCRLVLCHMNHLFCAVQTKEAMNKYLHSRLNGSQGSGLTALLPSEALFVFSMVTCKC